MGPREPFPERQGKDHVRALVGAGLASVPWIGGAGAELLNSYLPAAVEKRRERWFKLLDKRLADVEELLFNDEAFQTLVLQATRAAFGTHLEEKMVLLAEALRSAADTVRRGEDEFVASRLLRWVDELEPLHFHILGAIRGEFGWGSQVSWGDVLDQLSVEDDAWYEALDDLESRRLVETTGHNPELPTATNRLELIWVKPRGAMLVRFVGLMADDGEGAAAEAED